LEIKKVGNGEPEQTNVGGWGNVAKTERTSQEGGGRHGRDKKKKTSIGQLYSDMGRRQLLSGGGGLRDK